MQNGTTPRVGNGGKAPGGNEPSKATSAPSPYKLSNTNTWDTRQLVTMALMCAIGVLLSFIEFPLLPGVTWLKYDASAMPAMVCGFAFGPAAGLSVGVVGAVIHGILMADFSGALMNILVVTGFVLPAAAVYRRSRTFRSGAVGLALSVIAATIMAILGNLLVTPAWLGVPLDAVIAMILPILTPFNLAKGVLNAVLTLVVYKSVSNLITPKKKQVKGR
ncbi:ECF transporter S component [Gordonibacter sp. An230]|uniref:ECF transporter S component n=1 Tax=Gordonibacter sp. An230 TaxID=1965592 RepID=UPI000B37EBE8|nr:ECF transporter S component [Gordonibacter sp. An230]OUO89680.1 ECF transporter S component [Gordonibacter sp. An230]